ncbi:acetyl-CoA C-acetyltransferase [Vulgatibacter sp.]|uniref:acetyl-CoA C-acetyltransferase n=1 Tax=Vulgatibacter sp. TaxID=1971226 RepID=UPI003566FAA3
MKNEAWVIDAMRTPRGRGKMGKGSLSGIHPQELLGQTLNALADRTGVDRAAVDDVVVGCVAQVNEQGANIARNAVLAAGWPLSVTGTTLNRFCASGLQSVHFAAMGVMSGAQELVFAGGVESMSLFPIGADGGGQDGGNQTLRERIFQVPQGIGADLIATREGYTRAMIDEVALRSQRNAAAAIEAGRFARSLVPVVDPATGKVVLDREENPRPATTAEALAALPASFVGLGASEVDGATLDGIALRPYPDTTGIRHIHSAGNSSGLADGAAAVAVASTDFVRAHGLKPRARIRAMATVGSEPVIMLTGPAPASRKALRATGMEASDIDLWEINEAFAAVVLQTIRSLGIEEDRVNVNGGAIALGHPLGATGAMLLGTLIDELERRDLSTGLVTMCIGGGQGIATIVERV